MNKYRFSRTRFGGLELGCVGQQFLYVAKPVKKQIILTSSQRRLLACPR